MQFRQAMDLLCLTAQDVADMFGVQKQTVRQMRLRPGAKGSRTPPAGWERRFAELARERGEDLAGMADELERHAAAS